MKRYWALMLVLILTIGTLAACKGSGKVQEEEPARQEVKENEEESGESGALGKPEGYPDKTINWIVPVSAGAAVDLPTRALADVLDLGQPVVVENIAGASQTLGTAEAAARAADGYTLLTMANACLITQPLMNEVAYDLDDFRYIAMLAPEVPCTICVRADSPLETIDDFIKYVKENNFSYGVPNAGGVGHMAIASALNQLDAFENGTMLVYNGSNENITAILNGEADCGIVDDTDAISRVESKELRVLAVIHDEPSRLFPEAPLMSDYGIKDIGTFVGIKIAAVRADTSDEIVEWLKLKINEAIQSAEYQEYLENMGFGSVKEYSEEEIRDFIDHAIEEYSTMMRETGLIE